MPFIDKIETRAYARATEVPDRVVVSILTLFPEHLKQRVLVQVTRAEGQMGDAITIIAGVLTGQDDCDSVLGYILGQMDRQSIRTIERSLNIRLDEQCVFFLRIDKQAAFQGTIRMANESDVISVRFHFKQYPRCRRDDLRLLIEDRLRTAGGST
jgi:RNA binding exosome subunit